MRMPGRRAVVTSVCVALACVMMIGVAPPASAAAPTNDDPEDAAVISGLPFEVEQDTTDATVAPNEPNRCGMGNTIWYRFTPASTVRLVASTAGSEYSGAIAIYEGTQDAASTLACARGRHSFEAEGGTEYWFQVGGGRGVLRFSLEVGVPPRNDSMSSAQGMGRLPFSHEVDAHEATLDLKDPSCFGRGRSVWYSLKARRTDKISLRTIATYDTTISVYQRSSSGLRQLACTRSTRVRFGAERGKTYFIMVGSNQNGPGGLLEFRAKALPKPPPPLRIGLHVEPEGRVSSVTGTARIRGNVSCSVSTKVRIRVVIRQKLHRRVVSDSEYRTVKCTKKKKVARWSIAFAASRPFKKGPAGVYATAEADKKRRARDRIVALTSCGRCL